MSLHSNAAKEKNVATQAPSENPTAPVPDPENAANVMLCNNLQKSVNAFYFIVLCNIPSVGRDDRDLFDLVFRLPDIADGARCCERSDGILITGHKTAFHRAENKSTFRSDIPSYCCL